MVSRSVSRCALGLALLPMLALADGSPDTSLNGTWDVVRVAVDPADQPRWTWRPDDPRLLGRELKIAADALRFDGDDARCDAPKWSATQQALPALLRSSFARPPAPGRAAAPNAAELGIGNAPTQPVAVQRVRCKPDADGRVVAPWDDAWLVALSPDRLLLRHGQALLQLSRRAAGAAAQPSFRCNAAASDSEKALCGDVALAAWDRSVALAWKDARQRRADDAERLQSEQRAWLQERNRCGADKACLHDRMQERVDALVQE